MNDVYNCSGPQLARDENLFVPNTLRTKVSEIAETFALMSGRVRSWGRIRSVSNRRGFASPEILIIDHDTKYTQEFDAIFASEGTKVQRVGPRAPNLNAYAERFVQTLRQECLDHFVIFGEKHLRYLVTEFVAHYHRERPHQNLGNRPPVLVESDESVPLNGPIRCQTRLCGLLKHYTRLAA